MRLHVRMFTWLFLSLSLHLQQFKQVQADYEKRLRDVESQREQLLVEMETREASLITKVTQHCASMPCVNCSPSNHISVWSMLVHECISQLPSS